MAGARKNFINGKWAEAKGGRSFDDFNPANGSVYARITDSGRDDAARAIQAAADAQKGWAALPHPERARYMLKVADLIEKRQQDFVDALIDEAGSWIGKAMFEAGYAPGVYRAAAAAVYQVTGEIVPSEHGKISMIMRQPLGVVSVISPWNFPLLLTSRGISVAMAVGNSVVLKPSEESPVSGGLLLAEVFEEAGLPPGVLNVISCSRDNVVEVGEELVVNPHVRAISFTGSTAVGRQIAAKAGLHLKKACMELGGKDAMIILDDADITQAVNASTFGCFMHQGQICMSSERFLVQEGIADEFTEKFAANVKTLKWGDPRDMGKVIGPIINQKQLDKIHEQVTDAIDRGARLLAGGSFEGLFYQPTVLADVTTSMKIFQEENFGPVAPITRFSDIEDAIVMANDSEYGLSAGIITADEEKGLRIAQRLETGMAHINDSSVNDEPHVPFGGVKNSGLGRHGGKASVDTFTETRWITLERGGRHFPPPFVMKQG